METKMSNTKTGGPAFPRAGNEWADMAWVEDRWGMTLRDYFAAKAMQGLLANNNIDAQQIAKAAYIVADSMLKARDA
jgi:predicted 3-demethylubiquinone-9 3-methyltransferase (glyoxalase superfamily)